MSGHPSNFTRSVTPRGLFCVAAIASALLAATPKASEAQRCWRCSESDYDGADPSSSMCWPSRTGGDNCMQTGDAVFHTCEFYGALCLTYGMREDEEAVRMVLAGEMLPSDGGYYVAVDSEETVVLRKCDNSVVARLPSDIPVHTKARKRWRTDESSTTEAGV